MPQSTSDAGADRSAPLGWAIALVSAAAVLVYITLNLPALRPFWAAIQAVFS